MARLELILTLILTLILLQTLILDERACCNASMNRSQAITVSAIFKWALKIIARIG